MLEHMATFRETLWFKKGHLDAKRAEDAAADPDAIPAVDLLPVEDRYHDDGTIDATDSVAFSVRTGGTMAIGRLKPTTMSIPPLDATALVGEMKRGRRAVLAMLGATAIALAVLLFSL